MVFLRAVGNYLTQDIDKVINKCRAVLECIIILCHQGCRFFQQFLIIVDIRMSPAGRRSEVGGRPGIDDRFSCALIICIFAVVSSFQHDLPYALDIFIGSAINAFSIILHPFTVIDRIFGPCHIPEQFIHHRRVFNGFRRHADALHIFSALMIVRNIL